MNRSQQPAEDEGSLRQTPSRKNMEPLRQFGMGPTLLVAYVFCLVILQFFLVSLGAKSSLRSC